MSDNLDSFAATVRQHDRDRYLASLYAPEDKRQLLLALYAFDAELARVPFVVSEPQLGEIRLQWWSDSLQALFAGEAVDHPLAQALARAIIVGKLAEAPLAAMVEARRRELYADPMPNLNDLEGYLGETRSAVLLMAAQILLEGNAGHCAEVAGLGGVAQGISHILAAKPQLPGQGAALLPQGLADDALVEHGLARLAEARHLKGTIPEVAWPAFLPLASVEARLLRLKAKGAGASISALRAQWLLWRAARRLTF